MKSLAKQAIKGNKESTTILFSQFLAPDENIILAEHYGFNGLWHKGYHSFGCLTDRRVCSLIDFHQSCLTDKPAWWMKLIIKSGRWRKRANPLLAMFLISSRFSGIAFFIRVLTLPWQNSSGLMSGAHGGNHSTWIAGCSAKYAITFLPLWIEARSHTTMSGPRVCRLKCLSVSTMASLVIVWLKWRL